MQIRNQHVRNLRVAKIGSVNQKNAKKAGGGIKPELCPKSNLIFQAQIEIRIPESRVYKTNW